MTDLNHFKVMDTEIDLLQASCHGHRWYWKHAINDP